MQLFHANVCTALPHQEVLPHHVPIWRTTLPFLIKPLAEDSLIAHHELAIVMTHWEHDLVEHALIDPKPCKFGDVVGIDLTFPIVEVGVQMGGWSRACCIATTYPAWDKALPCIR